MFSLSDLKPKPNNWLDLELRYRGFATAQFSAPAGTITGPAVAVFDEHGAYSLELTCANISPVAEFDGPPQAFIFGAKRSQEGTATVWGFGDLDNPCEELTISTNDGVFIGDRLQPVGLSTQLVVARPEDAKPTILRFYLSSGRFETGHAGSPKYFVMPLINCVAELTDKLNGPSHPLRIYPTPEIPASMPGPERFAAYSVANERNAVLGFFIEEQLCFIERLSDYDDRLAQLEAGAQRKTTAVLVGDVGNRPVTTLQEFRSWFPFEALSALGFVSGVDLGFPWIEIRDDRGVLIRRLHGSSWRPTYDAGDRMIGKYCGGPNSGAGVFLTSYLKCSPEKRGYLEAVMTHARLGSLGLASRLYDSLDHLIRALECLCREHKILQQQLLPSLSAEMQVEVNEIRNTVLSALQLVIAKARDSGNFGDLRVLETIRSKAANIAATEKKFGLAVVALLEKFGFIDANLFDAYFAQRPRADGIPDWASVISSYRGATIHEGYMDFERMHDARDVARICRHLKDLISRLIFKEAGYVGTYESVLRRGYGPQPIDWITPSTRPQQLGGE